MSRTKDIYETSLKKHYVRVERANGEKREHERLFLLITNNLVILSIYFRLSKADKHFLHVFVVAINVVVE